MRTGRQVRLLVLAKEPVPGRVKTRLSPHFSPKQAAALALAALEDTLDTVALAADRLLADRWSVDTVLVLDGRPWVGLEPRWRIVPQSGNGLDERLAAAFTASTPTVLVGMDTPQLSVDVLVRAARCVAGWVTGAVAEEADACLGLALDGGWWLLALRRPDPALLLGLPMSTSITGAATAERLRAAGVRVAALPVLRDVDTAADAELVAAQMPPGSRFARAHDALTRLAS